MRVAATPDVLWEGSAHDLAIDRGAVYAATSVGVLVVDAGRVTTLTDDPARQIAVSGARVAYTHVDAETGAVSVRERAG